MEQLPRDRLEFDLRYALWRNLKFLRRDKGIEGCAVLASKIADHLELCGIVCLRKPQGPPHSTPGRPRSGE